MEHVVIPNIFGRQCISITLSYWESRGFLLLRYMLIYKKNALLKNFKFYTPIRRKFIIKKDSFFFLSIYCLIKVKINEQVLRAIFFGTSL